MFIKRLENYQKYKHTVEPSNKLVASYPLILTPIISWLLTSFFLAISIIFMGVTLDEFTNVPIEDKANGLMVVILLLSSIYFALSYLYTFILVYPLSKILKHNNGSKFINISLFILFGIIIGLILLFNYGINVKYGVYLIPISIFILGIFNIYGFKTLNELIKRDITGKIVYSK